MEGFAVLLVIFLVSIVIQNAKKKGPQSQQRKPGTPASPGGSARPTPAAPRPAGSTAGGVTAARSAAAPAQKAATRPGMAPGPRTPARPAPGPGTVAGARPASAPAEKAPRDGSLPKPRRENHTHEGKPMPCPADEREAQAAVTPLQRALQEEKDADEAMLEDAWQPNALVQGVVMAEVLNNPAFKRRWGARQ